MKLIDSFFSLIKNLPQWIYICWWREYADARIILEQNAELNYINISARMQRVLLRWGIIVAIGTMTALVFLSITSMGLMISRQQLERSHEAVYRALISSVSDGESVEKMGLSEEQMLSLAQTIRDRDMSIRRFVDTSMIAVSQENITLKNELDASGLTEKIIKIIQQNAAKGGFSTELDIKTIPLLQGKVADELANNRSLREVLYALPNRLPISNFSVISDFGIRKDPLSGKPHFHTGMDLLSETGDDKVNPVKPGVVVLSEYHPEYGNMVVVRHSNGVESLYAHMSQLLVKVSDKVTTDSLIGYIGNTGVSTGKHLHFEILVGGYPVNPQKVIRTAQYVQQIQKSIP